MSNRILPATCDAQGKVTADGVVVPEAQVLSLGKQASSGLLVIDGERVWYIALSATDIQTTLAKVSAAIDKLNTILQSIGASMTGPTTAPPPTLVTDLVALMTIKTEIDQLKEALK